VIAKTYPILVIDEPQSVEGKQTKENLKGFNPLFTLRYSAKHKKDSLYKHDLPVDAMEAYNKKLVKQIAVKGIAQTGTTGTDEVSLPGGDQSFQGQKVPRNLDLKVKQAGGREKAVVRKIEIGHNLYDRSGSLEQYRDGFTVTNIDGRDNSVTFQNGTKLYAGDVKGCGEQS
jgi:type III restriction enzyme